MNIVSIVSIACGGTAVLGAALKSIHAVYRWCQRLGRALEAVDGRSQQLVPNGGSSMRDAVDRIEAHLRRQDEAIADLQQRRARRVVRR